MRVTVWFPVLRALKCWLFLSGIMFNGQREQHAQRPRGRARTQTRRGATDAGAGGGGRRAGALGFTGKAARGRQRRGSKYGTHRLCVSGARLEILGLNVGLAEGTVLKFLQNA